MEIAADPCCRGRRRDSSIDERVLEVAHRHLGERGFAALSIAAIADEAGTTRQALYRRWPTKQSLVGDAIRRAGAQGTEVCVEHPRRDLADELENWLTTTDRAGVGLAAAMLQSDTPEAARDCYREHVLSPRAARLREILESAQALGQIDAAADLDAAIGMALGAGYAAQLAGRRDPDWAARTSAVVWRAVGGTEPDRVTPEL
jgi:AcrR family transcriptional regulator